MRVSVVLLLGVALAAALADDAPEGSITAMKGTTVRLGFGATDGLTRGALLAVLKGGVVIARARVISVSIETAVGQLVEPQAVEVVTVGDTVRLTVDARPKVTALPPPARSTGPATIISGLTVASVRNHAVALAGEPEGVRPGSLLKVQRGPTAVADARVERVGPKLTEATVVAYAPGQAVQVGDAALVTRTPRALPHTAAPSEVPRTTVPTRPPAQHSVAPGDRAYVLLAQLAASGLVRSVPARMLHQNTVLRRRPGDDVMFTRAQVAELIREALTNGFRDDSLSASNANALRQLVGEFTGDVRALGLDTLAIASQLEQRTRNAPLGVSGMAQLRGTRLGNAGPDPRSEPVPPESGLAGEGRLNLFGQFGRLGFFGQLDGTRRSSNAKGLVRNASLSHRLGPVELEAGRREFWYGPGQFGTLGLGDAAGGFDYFQTRVRRGDFAFEGFSSLVGRDPRRTLHVHRGEFTASPTVRFGASEMVMQFDGSLRPGRFVAANLPLPMLLGGGFGDNRTNTLFTTYAEASSPKGFRLYSEVMLDDLVVNPGETQNQRLGYLMGAQLFHPRAPQRFNARAEFASVNPRAYLTFLPPGGETESWFRNGQPLGYFLTTTNDLGQGLNAMRFDVNFMPFRKLSLGGGWELLDQGTGRAAVSRQSNLRIRASYDLRHDFSLTLRGVMTRTTNPFFTGVGLADRNRLEFEMMKAF